MSKSTLYRKAFRDIVEGFSPVEYCSEMVYIKHLTPHDQVELESMTDFYHSNAKERGLPTKEEMLNLLLEDGTWTPEDESIIKKSRAFISQMEQAKTKLVLKSAQDQQNELILKEQARLDKKITQKEELLGNTCEKYAAQRTHDFYMLRSFFKNKDLTKPLYLEREFDELAAEEVLALVYIYNSVFESFSEGSIQYLVLEDFYQPYLSFSDDSMRFYGLPFCRLTYNQIRLIVYTKIFKNIYENNHNIPERIKKDPKALLDYGSISEDEKEKMKTRFDESAGGTLVGATDEDYEYLGLSAPDAGISLHAEAKKKGGSLSMEDMMKLSGVS